MTSLHPDERFALVTLRDTVANLREHIACEAAELAAPQVAAVEEAAAARIAAAEQERDGWRQRFEDLSEEIDRQRRVMERQRDRLRAENDSLVHPGRAPESHAETRTRPTPTPDTRPAPNGAPRPAQPRARPNPPRTSA